MPEESAEPAEPPRPRTRTFVVLVLATLLLGVLLRLPTFSRPLLSDDEAIYATTADALARGGLLYRDVVDHKPPLIYHVYQAGFAALGSYNTHGAHALVILSVLLTAGLLLAIRWSEGAGLAAAGLFLLNSTTWHDYDALAANCELYLLVPQTAAACLLLRDLRRPAAGLAGFVTHLTVGVLIGVSALFKYQGLTFLAASVGVLGWSASIERAPWSWMASRAVAHLAGAVLPAALYLLGCVAAGNAADAVYWFAFNFSYVGAGLTGLGALARGLGRAGMIGGVALVPYALGLAAAVTTAAGMVRALRRQVRRSVPASGGGAARAIDAPARVAVLGVLWLATSVIALAAGGRFFGHYFHLILTPLCLLAAPGFCRLWGQGRAFRGALVALCALPALFFFWLATLGQPEEE